MRIDPSEDWEVIAGTSRSQAATMVLGPGESTGGPDNKHQGSDQWMYVVSGTAEATVGGETLRLQAGTLLLIEAGETHEIRASDDEDFVTLNIYAPPEY